MWSTQEGRGIQHTLYVDFVKTANSNVLISFTNFECSMSGFSDVYIFLKPLKTIKVSHFIPNCGHTQSQI